MWWYLRRRQQLHVCENLLFPLYFNASDISCRCLAFVFDAPHKCSVEVVTNRQHRQRCVCAVCQCREACQSASR